MVDLSASIATTLVSHCPTDLFGTARSFASASGSNNSKISYVACESWLQVSPDRPQGIQRKASRLVPQLLPTQAIPQKSTNNVIGILGRGTTLTCQDNTRDLSSWAHQNFEGILPLLLLPTPSRMFLCRCGHCILGQVKPTAVDSAICLACLRHLLLDLTKNSLPC